MTTRDISFPDGRPVTDKPDALPGPLPPAAREANAAPKHPFAAVIDQAMRRRPASGRSARSASPQRAAIKGEREKGGKGDISPALIPAFTPVSHPLAGPPEDPAREHPRRADEHGMVPLVRAAEGESAAPPDDLASSESGSKAGAVPDGLPQNIVLFPAPSVIIPFPLAEAKAMRGSARSGESSPGGEAAGMEIPLNVQRPTSNAERSMPAPDGFSSKAGAGAASDATKGVDLAKLGLTPVEDSGPPENVLPVEFAKAAAEEGAAGSEPSIISVSFRPSPSGQPSDSAETGERQVAQTQLPGRPGAAEESAPMVDSMAPAVEESTKGLNPTKAAVRAGLPGLQPRAAGTAKATGISAARQESRVESTTSSKQPAGKDFSFAEALPAGGREAATRQAPGALEALPAAAAEPSRDEGGTLNFSTRNLSATEWQAERPVSSSERPASDSPNGRTVDTTGTVERISKLVLGEAALIKQHSSDSMAVVLRPDAETELFVHLTQRNGQIEATVRCERGDLQHLGVLWGQLQESLAQQKVRLAPLQGSPSNQSNFNQPAGADPNGSGHGGRSQREGPPPPDKQFMDEWPVPASSSTDPAHVRGRGGSRHRRLTTSRPGWETWA